MLTLYFWVACFLMVSMLVCGYLCLIVKETTRDYEHRSIFTSLYICARLTFLLLGCWVWFNDIEHVWTYSIKLLYKLRYYSINKHTTFYFAELSITRTEFVSFTVLPVHNSLWIFFTVLPVHRQWLWHRAHRTARAFPDFRNWNVARASLSSISSVWAYLKQLSQNSKTHSSAE